MQDCNFIHHLTSWLKMNSGHTQEKMTIYQVSFKGIPDQDFNLSPKQENDFTHHLITFLQQAALKSFLRKALKVELKRWTKQCRIFKIDYSKHHRLKSRSKSFLVRSFRQSLPKMHYIDLLQNNCSHQDRRGGLWSDIQCTVPQCMNNQMICTTKPILHAPASWPRHSRHKKN